MLPVNEKEFTVFQCLIGFFACLSGKKGVVVIEEGVFLIKGMGDFFSGFQGIAPDQTMSNKGQKLLQYCP